MLPSFPAFVNIILEPVFQKFTAAFLAYSTGRWSCYRCGRGEEKADGFSPLLPLNIGEGENETCLRSLTASTFLRLVPLWTSSRWRPPTTCVYLHHLKDCGKNVIKIYLNRRIDPQKGIHRAFDAWCIPIYVTACVVKITVPLGICCFEVFYSLRGVTKSQGYLKA